MATTDAIDTRDTYRTFLESFAQNVDPTDQLPVRCPNFVLTPDEISGSIIDWSVQYLTDKWVEHFFFCYFAF